MLYTSGSIKNEIGILVKQLVDPSNYSEGVGKLPGEPSNIVFLRRDSQQRINQGNTFLRMRHERYVLTINLQTEGLVCVEGQTYHLPVNYASLVQPYQHHYYVVEQTDFSWLVITFDMLQQDLVRNFPVDCVAVNDFQLICIYRMLQIYLDILKGKTGLDQLLQRMLGNFLREMNLSEGHIDTGNAQEDASKNINMFERINKYIFARISDPNLNINEISKELDISITKLYSIFRLVSECNPGDYIRTQRIRRAIRMLGNTRYSVSEIARLNGFSSLAIFSRSFKNVVGQSPSQYVKDNL